MPRHPARSGNLPPRRIRHRARPEIDAETPVHVTIRVRERTWNLRGNRVYRVVREALVAASQKIRFRLIAYSVQGNHLHLVAEADDKYALSRAMRSLSIRIAKALNAMMKEHGVRIPQRYYLSVLKTAMDTRAALRYVLNNYRRHAVQWGERCVRGWVDPYSSALWFDGWTRPPTPGRDPCPDLPRGTVEPTSFFLGLAWKELGLLDPDDIPGPLSEAPLRQALAS